MYKLTAVSKRYPQTKRTVDALLDVHLVIETGEKAVVRGPTGGGKTTLLQLLGGLDRPTAGSVTFDGNDLSRLREAQVTAIRARNIGFVFQSFNLIPTLTAQENVEAALVPLGVKAAQRRAKAIEALDALGLADRRRHLPAELSGGQQQRVGIARALVKEPSVILADEPTGNLDEETRDEIIALLDNLWIERGLTLVIVTHDSRISEHAKRRLTIRRGRLTDHAGPGAGRPPTT